MTANYIQSGNSTVQSTGQITYTINAGSTLTLQNNFPNVGSGRTFSVNGTLMCGQNIVSGAGTFNLNGAAIATLGIGDANGITTAGPGNIQTTTRTYNTGNNLIYNGNNGQATGNGLPATLNSITIANSNQSEVVSLTNPTTITGALILNQGILSLGANNLTLGNTISISGNTFNSTNMIEADGTGALIRSIPTGASTILYPIGTNAGTADLQSCNSELHINISNVAVGSQFLQTLNSGSHNTSLGYHSMGSASSSSYNTALGDTTLNNITTGTNNTVVGYGSGGSLTAADSSNILIGNVGQAGLNNTIRIGTQGIGAGQQVVSMLQRYIIQR